MKMSEVFKCGDIATIINDNKTKIKSKKRSKLGKKFNAIIEENQNKIIKINNSKDFSLISNEEEDNQIESSETEDLNTITQNIEDPNEKNERTAFVGNLPKTVTNKILKRMFKEFGDIDSIRLRGAVPQKEKMSKKVAVITKSLHSGKDNINAYVVFKSKDDVSKALKLNGTVLEGHHIRVDSAVHDSTHDNSRSVFVGNLPFIVREDELHQFFEDCGDIESIRVIRDSTTGVGKGFGFILFKSKDSVVLALEKNDKQLLGRQLRVTRAKAKTNKRQNEHKSQHKTNNSDETQIVENTHKKFKKSDSNPEIKEISTKKIKKSNSKPEFEGISAKRIKKKSNKKKEISSKKTKKRQKKLAQIFSH